MAQSELPLACDLAPAAHHDPAAALSWAKARAGSSPVTATKVGDNPRPPTKNSPKWG